MIFLIHKYTSTYVYLCKYMVTKGKNFNVNYPHSNSRNLIKV